MPQTAGCIDRGCCRAHDGRGEGQRIPVTSQLPRPTRPAAATGSDAPLRVSLDCAAVVGGLRGAALNVANFHRSPYLLPRFPVKVVILRALPACSPQNCALAPWVAAAAQILCRVVDFPMRNEPARALCAMPPDLALGVLALGLHRLFTRARVACNANSTCEPVRERRAVQAVHRCAVNEP
jgi:hypothetical protein